MIEKTNGDANGYQDQLLTVEEVAKLLKVPRSWVYERTRRRDLGRLPCVKLGKYLRFEEREVREFLNRMRVIGQ